MKTSIMRLDNLLRAIVVSCFFAQGVHGEQKSLVLSDVWGHYDFRSDRSFLAACIDRHSRSVFGIDSAGSIRAWTVNGDPTKRLLNAGQIVAASFGPDCSVTAVATPEGSVLLKEGNNFESEARLDGSDIPVKSITFSPDGAFIAGGCADGRVRLWNARSHRLIRESLSNRGSVLSAVFSGLDKNIVGVRSDGSYFLWAVGGDRKESTFPSSVNRMRSIAMARDGLTMVFGFADGTVGQLAPESKDVTQAFAIRGPSVTSISPVSRSQILAGGNDGSLRLIDVHMKTQLVLPVGHRLPVSTIVVSEDGALALTAAGNELRLWDLKSDTELRSAAGHTAQINSLAISENGRLAITGSADQTARIWSVASGKQMRLLRGSEAGVGAVAINPDGELALSGNNEGKVTIWDTVAAVPRQTFSVHQSTVSSVAFFGDSDEALSASWDNTIVSWNYLSGTESPFFSGSSQIVAMSVTRSIVFVSDGNSSLIVFGRGGKILKAWKPNGKVSAIALSADGQFALTGTRDGLIELWNLANPSSVWSVQGSHNFISALAFSRDGTQLASTGGDQAVVVRRFANGSEIARTDLVENFDLPLTVTFDPSGSLLVGTLRGVVVRYSLTHTD